MQTIVFLPSQFGLSILRAHFYFPNDYYFRWNTLSSTFAVNGEQVAPFESIFVAFELALQSRRVYFDNVRQKLNEVNLETK